jgi:hypothetical protein
MEAGSVTTAMTDELRLGSSLPTRKEGGRALLRGGRGVCESEKETARVASRREQRWRGLGIMLREWMPWCTTTVRAPRQPRWLER